MSQGPARTTPAFVTPTIALGTAAAAGSTDSLVRSDATIVAFDATAPVTQAFGDAAATGSAAVAARRDHVHGLPTPSMPPQLTNGGFERWQRGTSFAAMTNLQFGPDRWQFVKAGTDTLTMAQEATTKQANSKYSNKCTFVLGTGAGASRLRQPLVIADGYHHLLGQPYSFAIDVKLNTGVASAVRAAVETDGTAGTTTFSGYHGNNTNWETLTVANTVIPTDATYVRVGLTFEQTVTLFADNARDGLGVTAPAFSPLAPAEELARVQRYYQVVAAGNLQVIGTGLCVVTSQASIMGPLVTEMGGTPTLIVSNATHFSCLTASGAASVLNALTDSLTNSRVLYLTATTNTANLVAGNATILYASNASAVLAVEWNP